MTPEQIDFLITESITRFKTNEADLFEINVNERSMTHKFAEYLQMILREQDLGFVVDCEYNRNGDDLKKIHILKSIVGNKVGTDDLKSKTVYPDIIVHKRGKNGPNILVIEAKKNVTNNNKENDIKKLQYIKNQIGYEHAVFLNFKLKEKDIEFMYV